MYTVQQGGNSLIENRYDKTEQLLFGEISHSMMAI
jgi:hypothetical protein